MTRRTPTGRAPSLMMAWRNLWRNRLWTALAALGIVIGVTAIAVLGITGTALQYGVDQQLVDLANHVTVSPAGRRATRSPSDRCGRLNGWRRTPRSSP